MHATAYFLITRKTSAPVMNGLGALGYEVAAMRSIWYFFSVAGSASYLMTWVACALFLICLDIVFGKDSPHHRRLFDLTGYAFYSQIPWLLAMLVIALTFEPPPLSLGGVLDQGIIMARVNQYVLEIKTSWPFVVTMVCQYYFQAWLMGLMVVCLASVAKLSWTRAIVYGVLLYGLFFLLPAAFL
ncbi:MAG: hypothetical protein ACLQGV_00830 [Bryobacteraceae bacterium]